MVRTVLDEKGFHSVRPEEISALVRDSGALDRTRNWPTSMPPAPRPA